ncbi:hypothetical protein C8R43DRAFT_1132563 [Mycena crocata]|nr:hypothetical protein C8R43DRAFT_1132563 [Mycena crocata]
MAFDFNSAHIGGGTFNSVSGNMSQVCQSHVVNVGRLYDGQRLSAGAYDIPLSIGDGGALEAEFPATATVNNSVGPIRTRQSIRNREARPSGDYFSLSHMKRASDLSTYTAIHRLRGRLMEDMSSLTIPSDVQPCTNDYHSPHENRPISQQFEYEEPLRNYSLPPQWPPEIYDSVPPLSAHHMFNSVAGDMTQLNVTSYGESGVSPTFASNVEEAINLIIITIGMDLLYRHVATEALHDSGERFPEPACHPGTRIDILRKLQAWSTNTTDRSRILWLHGCAGIGKSAIAQMFAGNAESAVIPTIAYQLATCIDGLSSSVQHAVENDRLIVGRAMATAFQRLLLQPFESLPSNLPTTVVILDGLDECADEKIQQQILRLFICAVRDHRLPIRLLVVSRPEPHLKELFEAQDAVGICQHFLLSAEQAAFDDIRIYLKDQFSRIHGN